MNPAEARVLLHEHLAQFRALSLAELRALVPASPFVGDRIAPSGIRYQIEVRLGWDDAAGEGVRVMGAIDDSGWRALASMREEFVVRPEPGRGGGEAG